MAEASSSSSTGVSQSEKLVGRESFNNWKIGMNMALIHENLLVYVDEYPTGDKTEQEARNRADQKSFAKICVMVQPYAYPYVCNANNAKQGILCFNYQLCLQIYRIN